jgi:hypothetical protein
LDDPRLTVRIQAANALRAQLGEVFNVDPWAEPAARAEAIQKWRSKLAAHASIPDGSAIPGIIPPLSQHN